MSYLSVLNGSYLLSTYSQQPNNEYLTNWLKRSKVINWSKTLTLNLIENKFHYVTAYFVEKWIDLILLYFDIFYALLNYELFEKS